MGIVGRMLNKTIFIDTAPLIYFIEGHSIFQDKLSQIFEANDKGSFYFQTSTLTLMEVLVRPLGLNHFDLADKYEKILTNSDKLELLELDVSISKRAAKLRAGYNLKTPDAIQLATAIEKGADLFFTNDAELKRVAEIEVVILKEL